MATAFCAVDRNLDVLCTKKLLQQSLNNGFMSPLDQLP